MKEGKTLKKIILDGNHFYDMESFYDEIEQLLTKNLDFKIGHNLNALNDVLRGGFGFHEYEEPILICWLNYKKSKKELGDDMILSILEIMLNCNDTGHNCKLELY